MQGVTPAQLVLFMSTIGVAILVPGPSVIALSQSAMSRGGRRSLPYALGLAVGASAWCGAAVLGLTAVFRLWPAVKTGFSILGGLYLLWVGWQMWRHAPEALPDDDHDTRGGFWSGILLNMSNPKPALFYSGILLSIFPAMRGAAAHLAVYLSALTVELVFYTALAHLMAAGVIRRHYFSAKLWIDRIAAVVIALLGLTLIFRP